MGCRDSLTLSEVVAWRSAVKLSGCVHQNKRSVSSRIITSAHSYGWLHVSFQNKASNRQQHRAERSSHLKAFVVLCAVWCDTCDSCEGRSIGVEKVPCLVRVVPATTTALRGWVIIVEGGHSGYLPCVSNSVHITDILMVMWRFIIYTSIRFPPHTAVPPFQPSLFLVSVYTHQHNCSPHLYRYSSREFNSWKPSLKVWQARIAVNWHLEIVHRKSGISTWIQPEPQRLVYLKKNIYMIHFFKEFEIWSTSV